MTRQTQPSVGLLWRGRPDEPPPPREQNRLRAIFDGFEAQGARTVALPFYEEAASEIRNQIGELDAVLTWVDPIVAGRDRSVLDALLRDASEAGVYVSAHPDVILKMGTKEVLVRTRDTEWGSDSYAIPSAQAALSQLPARLRKGPRVLKQNRGSGGNGVWKVELEGDTAVAARLPVAVLHAARSSRVEHTTLGEFIERCAGYFAAFSGSGMLIDQPYFPRVGEGMTRAYMAGDRVAGFGSQLVTALAPFPPGAEESPAPPARVYFGPGEPEFQTLRIRLESGWLAELAEICRVDRDDLPAIWDADFLLDAKGASGADGYVLCEVNVSGVFPIPTESIPALVDWTLARVAAGRGG
ncbi:Cj0069 family protein [Candidatus Amarobacter glycogenicus]|uniref:Cj0069 family protein n=1 Tax=Candidatus Amarobacter glycogenicus TaxID=3140699 RepID=UPI0031356CDB|nr:Cj0069 family protein [Dehalococcoidia bacterium]